MANRDLKRYPVSFIITEMQIKTITPCRSIPTMRLKKKIVANVGAVMRKQLSHAAIGSVYWYNYFGKLLVTTKAGSLHTV